jgi:hypothetical protein
MKVLLALITSLALLGPVYAADEGPGKGEIKEVCKDKKDKAGKIVKGKDGNPVQECKKIKVRKKVEGDKIPEPSKKK